jgi:PAS domain S-box-containing protein
MLMETTRSGLAAVGEVPWGTHFCQFYRTADDLADALVPFFRAGLDNNEQCIWVTCEPLSTEEARAALTRAAPDLDERLQSGQVEILDFGDWYLRGGEQDVDAVLNKWIARKEEALARGYSGLRVSGNSCRIETQQWRDFAAYEAKVNACLREHRILALCSYHLDRCTGTQAMDVLRNHEFAILHLRGEWRLIESPSLKLAKEDLRRRNETLLAGQKRVLEMVATSAPLADTLAELMRFIEAQEEGLRCGILTVSEDGGHFQRGYGPSLPEAYHKALEGVPIRPPYLGPCGEAAHRGKPVVVSDVAADTRWADAWRDLARSCGLEACHSTPVVGSDGRMLASFAMYYDRPRDRKPVQPELIGIATHLAGIAIERRRAEKALRKSEERLAAELAATQRLQETSSLLIQADDADALYDRILDSAVALMHADMASMQMLDQNRGELRLLAWKGFHPESAAFWQWVRPSSGASCGAALASGRRVVVPDIESCGFILGTPDFDAFRKSGIRAMQSTPLVSRSGRLLGMISTHWREPHEPRDRELRLFDVLARQAADVIERAEAEAALGESEERYRATFEQAASGIAHAALDGRWLAVNDRLCAITGYTRDELLRLSFQDITHPDDLEPDLARLRALLAGEIKTFSMEKRYFRKDRSIIWVRLTVSLLRDRRGEPKHLIAVIEDFSAIKAAEAALREMNDTLERKVEERTRALQAEMAERRKVEAALQQVQRLEAIGQLTGGVAHDFNNLLTVVVGQTEAIAMAAGGNDKIARMTAAIQRAAERGARLTGQLLAFSRQQRLRPAAVTIDRLTANIDDLVRRAVGETIEVAFSITPDLWPTLVDPAQFESALLNLVLNARDAMPTGGRLTIGARNAAVAAGEAMRLDAAPGDYVVISVTDTGMGMPPDVREHAFEPFFTTKDVGKGTGLGLAQIYGFAKQSGGAATIESTMGHGTTVSLYLPRAETSTAQDDVSPHAARPPKGRGKTILVVEDQPEVREVIEMSLNELGYRILTAPDGVAARQVLESDETIDLLLTDIVMPNGVSGIDLAQAARRLRQDLKIVLVSGYSRDDQARAGGLSDEFIFLEKPFRQAELAGAIAAALGRGAEAAE